MNDMSPIRPLVTESSTSESTTVEVVMNDLRDSAIRIPDYQRDSDQWSVPTKSLLVESVINNLCVPAFFFETMVRDGIEYNDVIDGQQRLTTLFGFFQNKYRLVDSEDAPYLSPNSVHYAGRTYDELPETYKAAFRKYRLTVIKLRNLGDMRLEVFRRINQGGTPLSGQDIRLAYYGENSPAMAFIRIAGIYDPARDAARRFLTSAATRYDLAYPWTDELALDAWNDWWSDKEISHGQTASEAFLWSLLTVDVEALDALLTNSAALNKLGVRFNKGIEEALDVYCAQMRWQDTHDDLPPVLMTLPTMRERFFPYFQVMIRDLLCRNGPSLPVTKYRLIASVVGACFATAADPASLTEADWTNLVEFARNPQAFANRLGMEWPQSKGRWDGSRGYREQLKAAKAIVARMLEPGRTHAG